MPKKIIRKAVVPPRVRPVTEHRVSLAAQTAQASKDLVVMEDATLRMLVADPRFTAVVPCLAGSKAALASVGSKCGSCARKRNQATQAAMNQLRLCIASLSGPNKEAFKQLLGAKKVRVITDGGTRQVTL